jgi:hypothetical protein
MASVYMTKKLLAFYFVSAFFCLIFLYAPTASIDLAVFHNDDHNLIKRLSDIEGFSSALSFIFNIDHHKFRPISNFQYLMEYYLFSENYSLYVYYNIFLVTLLAIAILFVLHKIHGGEISWVAYIAISAAFITSKFLIYSIWNITGSFETLASLFFVTVIHYLFLPNKKRLIFFSICLLLTSERFLPFIFIVPILYFYLNNNENLFKITLKRIILPLAILMGYASMRFALGLPIIVGTQTDNIAQSFSFNAFSIHILQSYIEIFGFSSGPAYLTGFKFADWVPFTALVDNKPYFSQLVIFSILFVVSLYAFIFCIFSTKKKEIALNIIALSVIAAASITFRLELRWLLPAYFSILLLVSSCLLTNTNQFSVNLFKKSLFTLLIISTLSANIIYAVGARPSLYFADKLHQASIFHHFYKSLCKGE